MSIITFYEGDKGKFIDSIETAAHCVWASEDMGKADFDLVVRNPKVTERLTRPGNMITVEKDPDLNLPIWEGILDDDLGWTDGKLKITATTPHQLYNWRDARVMKKNGDLYEDRAGAIVKKYIELCNADEDLRVRPGKVDITGDKVQSTLDTFFYDTIRAIANKGYYWQFRSFFGADHSLLFYLDFVQSIGRVLTNVHLVEGKNFEKMAGQQILRQVGPIINQFAGLSDASTDDDRFVWIEQDKKSVGKYRLRQSAEVFSGVTEEASVKANTKEVLRKYKNPRNVPAIVAQNVDDLFEKIRLGNVLKIIYKESGWNAGSTGPSENIQITVMDHNDLTPGKITLAAMVVD